MYLHLGGSVVVLQEAVIAVFDLDNTSASPRTRHFLKTAEREGRVTNVAEDIPKSFVLCRERDGSRVYLSGLTSVTLLKRAESTQYE